jgi:hypothetical protein
MNGSPLQDKTESKSLWIERRLQRTTPTPPTQNIPVVYVEVSIGVCAARAGKSVAFPAVKTGQNADSAAVSQCHEREMMDR